MTGPTPEIETLITDTLATSILYSNPTLTIHPNLTITHLPSTPENRSIYTSTPIPPHTIIAAIPISSTLSTQSLINNVEEIASLATFGQEGTFNDDDLLSVFLVCVKYAAQDKDKYTAQTSRYIRTLQPLIDNLPTTHASSIFFSPTSPAYSLLTGTTLQNLTTRMQSQISSDYTKITTSLRKFLDFNPHYSSFFIDPALFTFELYVWGLFTVYSRAADVRSSVHLGVVGRLVCPFMDMLNHGLSGVRYDFVSDGGSGSGDVINIVSGSKVVEAGTEVLLNYGPLSNTKLLLFYGFSLPSNINDTVQLHIPLDETAELYDRKVALIKKCCVDRVDKSVHEPYILTKILSDADVLPVSLLSVLRLLPISSESEMRDIESKCCNDDDGSYTNGVMKINAVNEYNALKALESALHEMSQTIAINILEIYSTEKTVRAEGGLDGQDGIDYDHAKIYAEGELEILATNLTIIRNNISSIEEDEEGGID